MKSTARQRHQRAEAKRARRRNRTTNPLARNYRSPMARALSRVALMREGEKRMGAGR